MFNAGDKVRVKDGTFARVVTIRHENVFRNETTGEDVIGYTILLDSGYQLICLEEQMELYIEEYSLWEILQTVQKKFHIKTEF